VRFVIPVHLSQRAAAYEFEPIVGVLLQVGAFHLAQRQGVQQIDVQSSSATCTVSQPPRILGREEPIRALLEKTTARSRKDLRVPRKRPQVIGLDLNRSEIAA
jgi:hypothetical protein